MKIILLVIPAFIVSTFLAKSQDTVDYSFRIIYSKDFSDTFGGGSMLCGDVMLSKCWYGLGVNYGFFQSHNTITYQLEIEEDSQTFEIPFDELATMQTGSIFGTLTPIKKDWFNCEIVFGVVYGTSKNLCFKSLSYTYNTIDNILLSVEKDYYFINKTHFGYQGGVNFSFKAFKNIGIQLTSRLYDLSNGGTFFFAGGGLIFNL